jgi:hypothetical protein
MTIEHDSPSNGENGLIPGRSLPATMTPVRSRRNRGSAVWVSRASSARAAVPEYLPARRGGRSFGADHGQTGQFGDAAPFPAVSRIPELAGARISELEKLIRSVGFYRSKARKIRALAQRVIERHGGALPSVRDELMSLPEWGVNRQTSSLRWDSEFPRLPWTRTCFA